MSAMNRDRGATVRHFLLTFAWLAVAVVVLMFYWRAGQPQSLPDVPAGKLQCMSYTPRQGPQLESGVTVAQIEEDLELLAPHTHCVRTYSVLNGMDAVPAVARKLGLRVMLGVWIGSDAATNEKEIEIAIETAKRDRDVIDAIIVGNEVLLRHEQPVEVLRAYIERVHAATRMPVTYADVWEFWRRHETLARSVSLVTIHILPYWEDNPVAVDAALEHIRNIYTQMQQVFPGKRVIIGETGWPTAGRQREGAVPSIANAARFAREFVAYADSVNLPYNFIEAFDQPWKRALEGTVGGYWGLYDVQGRSKYPLQGAVVEDPHWWWSFVAAALGALMFTAAALGMRATRNVHSALLYCAGGLAAGAVLYAQWRYLGAANRDAKEWAVSLIGALWAWSTYLVAFLDVAGGRLAAVANVTERQRRLRHVLRLGLLFGLAYVSLGLATDGRYRDFPVALAVLPMLTLAIAPRTDTVLNDRGRTEIEERLLAAIIVLASVITLIKEGPLNLQSWLWCGLSLLFALSVLAPLRFSASPHERTEQHACARRVEAVQHASHHPQHDG